MENVTDWLALWRQLASKHPFPQDSDETKPDQQDYWQGRARDFHAQVRRRWAEEHNSSRDVVLARVSQSSTVLDIGAGTGAWAIPLAPHVRKVTALEASPAMIEVLRESLDEAGVDNVEIVQGRWQDLQVERHDFTLCSHAMYGFTDFAAFVRSLLAATRDTCFLNMRVPTADGVIAQAALKIWGHLHVSANGVVAFNALLQMGLFPSFVMEDGPPWEGWSSPSLKDALSEIKSKLNLADDDDRFDEFLDELLRSRLIPEDDHYRWPPETRSVLISLPARSPAPYP